MFQWGAIECQQVLWHPHRLVHLSSKLNTIHAPAGHPSSTPMMSLVSMVVVSLYHCLMINLGDPLNHVETFSLLRLH